MREFLFIAVFSVTLAAQPNGVTASALTDSILTWLPANTETVLVAQQPFTIKTEDRTNIPTALEAAQSYSMVLLASSENHALLKRLSSQNVRLAVAAARRFGEQAPNDQARAGESSPVGIGPYQGCSIYAFAGPLPATIITRAPDDSVSKHPVWTSKGSKDNGRENETYFVSLLKSDLMLACNRREFFEEVVGRMDSRPKTRAALPDSLAEWKQLDRTAPVWAISHFASSAQGSLPGISESGATGVIVEYGGASGPAKARMIAKQDPWKDLAAILEPSGGAKSREVTPGVWELSVESKRPEAGVVAVLMLMGAVGFFAMM